MSEPFVSYAQNAEDVVLWRALGHLPDGRYVEIGANHPVNGSITKAFYDRGWSGLEVEPIESLVQEYRQARPRDTVVQAAVTDQNVDSIDLLEVEGANGLSTTDSTIGERHRATGRTVTAVSVPAVGLATLLDRELDPAQPVHFMVIDVEGVEAAVIRSADWQRWRPWVLVVEATEPMDSVSSARLTVGTPTHGQWEDILLENGYQFCLFDGLSRFYVATERAAELAPALSVPAPIYSDAWVTHREHALRSSLAEGVGHYTAAIDNLNGQVTFWRGLAVADWMTAAAGGGPGHGGTSAEAGLLRQELEAMKATVSWRVTEPLRAVRRAQLSWGRGL